MSKPMMRVVAAAVRANIPILLWGDPGVGKTAVLTNSADSWGFHLETIIGSTREPSDFTGLPVVNDDGGVDYAPLDWAQRLVSAERGMLFLDELSCAPPSAQRAMLRIIQERVVGPLTLPDSVVVIAAANPPEIAVDGWELAAPTANRFMHIDWHFDRDAWFAGVVNGFEDASVPSIERLIGKSSDTRRAVIRAAIVTFLRARPDLLDPGPPTSATEAGRAWPSPRSWDNAMAVLSELPEDDFEAKMMALCGCVGDGAGREYLAWEQTMDLIDPDEAMAHPERIKWSEERPDRLFALLTAVSTLVVSRGDELNWRKGSKLLVACADGGKPDVAMPAARKILNAVPDGVKVPSELSRAFVPLLEKIGMLAASA